MDPPDPRNIICFSDPAYVCCWLDWHQFPVSNFQFDTQSMYKFWKSMETKDDLAMYLSAVRACQCPISELNLEHEVLSS